MALRKKGVNKVGYSSLVGMLCLAYFSEIKPVIAGFYFLTGFATTFFSILILEMFGDQDDKIRH